MNRANAEPIAAPATPPTLSQAINAVPLPVCPHAFRYMADEARSLKAYGELPDNIRVNDTDTFADEEGGENDDYIDFDDISEI